MSDQTGHDIPGLSLRRRAEERLRGDPAGARTMEADDLQRLVHELQVHEVELQVQNEELLKAQQDLADSRDNYARLYDLAPVGHLTLDREGLVREANLRAAVMLAEDRNGLAAGRDFADFVDSPAREKWLSFLRRMLESGEEQTCELPLRARDGAAFWARIESATTEPGVEEGTRCLMVLADITEQKRAENALRRARDELEDRVERRTAQLREAEEQFRALASDAPVAIAVARAPDGRVLFANSSFLECLRVGPEELDHFRLLNLFSDPEDRKAAQGTMGEGEKLVNREICGRRHDGTLFWSAASLRRIPFAGEQAVAGVFSDVTARREVEQRLRLTNQLLGISNRHTEVGLLLQDCAEAVKSFTGAGAVGVRLMDDQGQVPYLANRGFSDEFLGKESPLSIHSHHCMCINVIKGETDPGLPFYTEAGSFYMGATTRFLATVSEKDKGKTRNVCNEHGFECVGLVPLRGRAGILGLIHVADARENAFTLPTIRALEEASGHLAAAVERIRMEEDLQQLNEELEQRVAERTAELERNQAQLVQAAKVTALGRLAAGIAHEIGNPLSALSVRIQRLRTQRSPTFIDEAVELMGAQVDRMSRILGGISSLTSSHPRKPGPCRIDSLVESVVGLLNADTRGRKVRIDFEVPKAPVNANADEDLLRQVFLNIGINALEAMPKGGLLTVEVKALVGRACISFKDAGSGMSLESSQRLFEPFYSTKSETHMGLGLALCKDFVEAEGGSIEFDSADGKGSVFRVLLPLHAG